MRLIRQGRDALGLGVAVLILTACGGAPAPPPSPTATLAPATVPAAAATPSPVVAATPSPAPTAMTALVATPEEAIHQHFRLSKLGAESLIVRALQVLNQNSPDKQYFQVTLDALLSPGVSTPWNAGLNTRFVTVERLAGSWKVTEVATAPTVPAAGPPPTKIANGAQASAEAAVRDHFSRNLMGAKSLALRSSEALATPDPARQQFRVTLEAALTPGVPSPLSQGANTRFVTVEKIGTVWKVTEVAATPDPGSRPGFQRVGGRDLGISFEVPAGWAAAKAPTGYTFRRSEGAPIAVGVVRQAIQPGFSERALLPNQAEIVRREPVDLGWAKGTKYTLKVGQPAAGAGAGQEVHVILRLDGKAAYDIFSVAPTGDAAAIKAADAARLHLVRSVAVVGG